ncbi:MAG: hypothetical protein R6X06_11460, partial [Gammaproteobacteria bacterium]
PAAPTMASELERAGYNLGYAGKWHVDRDKVPSDYHFRGKDYPGYGYPPTDGLVEGLRFMSRLKPAPHYADYLRDRGLEPPKVLEAYYGANPGQPGHEIHALQSGTIEQSFEAERQVRAFNPWPVAYTMLEAQPLRIYRAEVVAQSGAPGTILSADKHGLIIACGQNALRLQQLQAAGGKVMDAAAFMHGHGDKLVVGAALA